MKKMFITDTEQEIKFGDTIQLDLSKKSKQGISKFESTVKVTELTAPVLLQIGAIEIRDVENDSCNIAVSNSSENEEQPCDTLNALIEDFETLEQKVEKIDSKVEKFIDMHKAQLKMISNLIEAFKDFMCCPVEKHIHKKFSEKKQ